MSTTADRRRAEVLQAAIHEFAEHGFHATRTAAIAARAGISQPYIYALFPDKLALFLATLAEVRQQITTAFTGAWSPGHPAPTTLTLMGRGYRALLANPDAPRCLIQGHAASADPQIRAAMRDGYIEVFELVRKLSGAEPSAVARFMANGLLLNLGSVLELPPEYVTQGD